MSVGKFSRAGFVTAGNPNHYDGSDLLLRELRARSRDADEPQLKDAVRDLETSHEEDYGCKLSEREAINHCLGDVIADYLSDAAPDGYVFEIRRDSQGNSNWGYFVGNKEYER